MSLKITDKDMGMKALIDQMKAAGKKPYVKIGILSSTGSMSKKSSNRKSKSALTVLDVGVYNEFGTKDIPQRPFIRTTYDEKKESWFSTIRSLSAVMISGKITAKKILGIVGLQAVADTKKTIKSTHPSWPPNKPSTIKRKKSSKPLIDTGQLINSIQHQVDMMGRK